MQERKSLLNQKMIVFKPMVPFQRKHYFPDKDIKQLQLCITQKQPNIQTLIKFIYRKFHQEGLRYTLINKLFNCNNASLQFYVPELVYIAAKKQCCPLRKFLIKKSSQSENLSRLILWNLKAFTILMKQKDYLLREFVDQFQEDIKNAIAQKQNFVKAEKSIAMLTTASLVLKQMELKLKDKVKLKAKLKNFIKSFNSEKLRDFNHNIIIPFRKQKGQLYNSNYVVAIAEDDCSCFPTRKRVPYRIIIQTIDICQRGDIKHIEGYRKKAQIESQMDLYQQVDKAVTKKFSGMDKLLSKQALYATDKESKQNQKNLISYQETIVKKQQNQQKKRKTIQKKMTKSSYFDRGQKQLNSQSHQSIKQDKKSNLKKKISMEFEITKSKNLQKFDKINIKNVTSNVRMTSTENNLLQKSIKRIAKQKVARYSTIKQQLPKFAHQVNQSANYGIRIGNSVWGEPFEQKKSKLKKMSKFSNYKSLKMHNVVVKGGDDLRQQIICMQLIYKMKEIIDQANVDVVIKPYQIIVLSQNSGLLGFVPNSISIDGLKKQKQQMTLYDFFQQAFTKEGNKVAIRNFVKSLAGSSVLTYVLKLKDRHNGNILLDNQGNIIHIDFGFILGLSPGGINFETSPFKFTEEYLDLMGGKEDKNYADFTQLFCDAMIALRKRYDQLCIIIQIMMDGSDLECFQNYQISSFKDRFKIDMPEYQYVQYCKGLIEKSCMNSRTAHYDYFQFLTNGITQ